MRECGKIVVENETLREEDRLTMYCNSTASTGILIHAQNHMDSTTVCITTHIAVIVIENIKLQRVSSVCCPAFNSRSEAKQQIFPGVSSLLSNVKY